MQAAPVMTTGHTKTLDLLERDLITCHLKVEALQTQLVRPGISRIKC